MLTIRLQRAGRKNKADFRIVLAEKTAASQKKFTEVIGAYNPHTKALHIRDEARLNYWVNEQHVDISATVRNLFISKDLIKGGKVKAFTVPKKEVAPEETPAPAAEENTEAKSEITEETEKPAEELAEKVEENAPEAVAETPAEAAEPATEESKEEAQA